MCKNQPVTLTVRSFEEFTNRHLATQFKLRLKLSIAYTRLEPGTSQVEQDFNARRLAKWEALLAVLDVAEMSEQADVVLRNEDGFYSYNPETGKTTLYRGRANQDYDLRD